MFCISHYVWVVIVEPTQCKSEVAMSNQILMRPSGGYSYSRNVFTGNKLALLQSEST